VPVTTKLYHSSEKKSKNDKKAHMKTKENGKIAGCFCVIVAFFQTPWLEQ